MLVDKKVHLGLESGVVKLVWGGYKRGKKGGE